MREVSYILEPSCTVLFSHDYNYDYWFNDSYSGKCPDNTCICRRVFCSKYKTGNYFGEGGTFFFPIIVGNYIGVGFGGGEGGIYLR